MLFTLSSGKAHAGEHRASSTNGFSLESWLIAGSVEHCNGWDQMCV